jgi:hypothetical protein
MDYGKSFVFMFEDPNWLRKLGIGTLVGLLGIVLSPVLIGLIPLIMLVGYSLDALRNVMDGQPTPLPEWEDWGGFLVRGLKVAVAFIVWAFLPWIILAIPLSIGISLGNQNGGGAEAVGVVLMVCASCLMALWGIFVALISPAITIRLAATDRFGSAFEVGRLWRIPREHLGPVIISLLLTAVAGAIGSIVGSLGIVLCLIGALITGPLAMLWQYLVAAHLFGQIGGLDRAARSDDLVPFEPLPAPIEVAPSPAPVDPPAIEVVPISPEPPVPDAPTGQQQG